MSSGSAGCKATASGQTDVQGLITRFQAIGVPNLLGASAANGGLDRGIWKKWPPRGASPGARSIQRIGCRSIASGRRAAL